MKRKVCLLGAGRVALHYKEILSSIDNSIYDVVGVCDINSEKSKSLADSFCSQAFTSSEDMLRTCTPDITFILTPSGLHFEHSMQAISLGSHVLVEKPAVMLPEQGYMLINHAASHNRKVAVAFQNRFNPAIQVLKRAIEANRFGRIITATIRLRWCRYQSYYEDAWHGTWLNDGGVINQQAIHHVDALNWLVGPVKSVCSSYSNRLNDLEAEDTLTAILEFEHGALGTIEATTAARPRDIEASLSIVGETGIVEIGGIALNEIKTWEFIQANETDLRVATNYSQVVPNGYGLSHRELIERTLFSLGEDQSDPPVSLASALETTSLIHAIYSSAEKRGWVDLTDCPVSAKLGK